VLFILALRKDIAWWSCDSLEAHDDKFIALFKLKFDKIVGT